MPFSDEQRRRLLDVARAAIRATVFGRPVEPPADAGDDPELKQPAGCFVSLHEAGTHRLRGCVGRLEAREPVLRAVHDAAVSVPGDPRFEHCDPIRPDELPRLEIELTILSPLRDVPHPLDFEPLAHGIYLTLGGHGGCFLPQVARDTGWDREQLLERLCTEKLGLPPHAWRHPSAKLQTFDAEIIGPEPFDETSRVTGPRDP
jgi:AmmeMemoRadiSam system protein A